MGHLAVADACRLPDCTGVLMSESYEGIQKLNMSVGIFMFLRKVVVSFGKFRYWSGDCGGPMAFSTTSARDPIFFR